MVLVPDEQVLPVFVAGEVDTPWPWRSVSLTIDLQF
jgi:hypothetical protein